MSPRTVIPRLLAKSEAMLLASLGLYMLALARSDSYWLLLNPKYAWLTAAGGVGVTLVAFALFLVPAGRPGAWRMLAMAGFVLLLVLHDPQMSMAPRPALTLEGISAAPSRIELDGREYVRINTAELFFLARQADPARLALGYVAQGLVARTPDMDARGELALLRLTVNCCLADAVGLGVRVRAGDPASWENGQWIRVHGRLASSPNAETLAVPQLPGAFVTALAEGFILEAEGIETAEPELPFIFEVRQEEPYAY